MLDYLGCKEITLIVSNIWHWCPERQESFPPTDTSACLTSAQLANWVINDFIWGEEEQGHRDNL